MSDEISPRTNPQISMYLKTSDAEGVSGTELTDFDEGSPETPLLEIEEMNVEDKHEGHESMLNTTPLEVGFAQMSGLRRHVHAIFQWEPSTGVICKFALRTSYHVSFIASHGSLY
jgi:hypothetical protein